MNPEIFVHICNKKRRESSSVMTVFPLHYTVLPVGGTASDFTDEYLFTLLNQTYTAKCDSKIAGTSFHKHEYSMMEKNSFVFMVICYKNRKKSNFVDELLQ